MEAGRATQFSAAGSIAAVDCVCSFHLSPGVAGDAGFCTAVIKEGGVAGTTVLTMSTSGHMSEVGPVRIAKPYLASITAGALLTVVM